MGWRQLLRALAGGLTPGRQHAVADEAEDSGLLDDAPYSCCRDSTGVQLKCGTTAAVLQGPKRAIGLPDQASALKFGGRHSQSASVSRVEAPREATLPGPCALSHSGSANQPSAAPRRTDMCHTATQRSVTALVGGVVARAAARRHCHHLLPPPALKTMLPGVPDQRRASARLGRLLSCLAPRASSESAASSTAAASSAGTAAPPPGPPPPSPLASGYRLPPKEIADIVDAPPEPLLSFSPDRKTVLQLSRPPSNPPISELARPELKLAGEQAAGAVAAVGCGAGHGEQAGAAHQEAELCKGPVLAAMHRSALLRCAAPCPLTPSLFLQACGWTPRPSPAPA